jgi:hypothetical protein
VIGGLVDQHMVLPGEEPRQRARRELVTAIVEQVGRRSPHDEIEFELVVPVGAWRSVGREVVADVPVEARSEPQILGHRKKR